MEEELINESISSFQSDNWEEEDSKDNISCHGDCSGCSGCCME